MALFTSFLGLYEKSFCLNPQKFVIWTYIQITCKKHPIIWLYTTILYKNIPNHLQILNFSGRNTFKNSHRSTQRYLLDAIHRKLHARPIHQKVLDVFSQEISYTANSPENQHIPERFFPTNHNLL